MFHSDSTKVTHVYLMSDSVFVEFDFGDWWVLSVGAPEQKHSRFRHLRGLLLQALQGQQTRRDYVQFG